MFQLTSGTDLDGYLDYIGGLPLYDKPGLFGLHDNADISRAQAETLACLQVLLSLQPREGGGKDENQEDEIMNMASRILSLVPKPITDMEGLSQK